VPGDPVAGYLVSNDGFIDGTILLVAAASLCFYGAGLLLNDLVDLSEDRLERPSRPLPSGQANPTTVRLVLWLLNALGSTGNQFQGLLPHPVQLILAEVMGIVDTDLEDAIFLAWWKANEEPLFFRSGATAKCLRRLFKRQRRGSV
jgi:hypothetical protein